MARTGMPTIVGMVILLIVVTSSWLMIAISTVLTIVRVALGVEATTITSVTITFTLVSMEFGRIACGLTIIWVIPIMMLQELHLASYPLLICSDCHMFLHQAAALFLSASYFSQFSSFCSHFSVAPRLCSSQGGIHSMVNLEVSDGFLQQHL